MADIHRFFGDIAYGNRTTYTLSHLLNIQNIQNFYTTLKQVGKAAPTIAEKLRRVREAVKFTQLSLEEDGGILYMKAQKVLDFLASCTKKMSRAVSQLLNQALLLREVSGVVWRR